MNDLDSMMEKLATVAGVMEVAAADDTGSYAAGLNNEKPEEFAAILAFVGRAGTAIGDTMGMESLESVRISGKRHRLFIAVVPGYTIGVRIAVEAVAGPVQNKVKKILSEFAFDMEDGQ